MTAWVASVLCGALTVVLVLLLGGPTWAAFGFGYITFLIVRMGDKK